MIHGGVPMTPHAVQMGQVGIWTPPMSQNWVEMIQGRIPLTHDGVQIIQDQVQMNQDSDKP